jgi:hypothetical protein
MYEQSVVDNRPGVILQLAMSTQGLGTRLIIWIRLLQLRIGIIGEPILQLNAAFNLQVPKAMYLVKTYQTVSLKTKFSLNFVLNTFKYHVSCADGKISVRIIYFYYLFFHLRPTDKLSFLSCRPKQGDRRNYKTCWKCRVNNERPTGNKTQLVRRTTVEQ